MSTTTSWFRRVLAKSDEKPEQPAPQDGAAVFKDGIYSPPIVEEEVPKRSLGDILLDAEPLIVKEKPVEEDQSVEQPVEVLPSESSIKTQPAHEPPKTEIYPVVSSVTEPSIVVEERKVKKLAAAFEAPGSKPPGWTPSSEGKKSTLVNPEEIPSDEVSSEKLLPSAPVAESTPAVSEPLIRGTSGSSLSFKYKNLEPTPSFPAKKADANSVSVTKSLDTSGPSTVVEIFPESSTLNGKAPYATVGTVEKTEPVPAMASESEIETAPLLGRATPAAAKQPLLPVINQHLKQWKLFVGWGEQLASESVLDDIRLTSLDVFRGLVIAAFLVLVNSADVFPFLNYSAWDGISFGDFLDPFFLFIVGVSVAIAFKRVPSKRMAFSKVFVRTLKIFLIGLFLQGGYYHGPTSLTYGVDLVHLRYSGTLQRIAIAFFIVGLSEIAVMKRFRESPPEGFWQLSFRFMLHWGVALLLALVYIVVTYFLFVPDWDFSVPTPSVENGPHIALPSNDTVYHVQCGVSGDLSPACNAAGYVDRLFLGLNHLAQNPSYQASKACTEDPSTEAPSWCLAPFEADGILPILGGTLTAFAGLHFGHVITHFRQHWVRLSHVSVYSGLLTAVGWALRFPLKAELHRIFDKFPDWLILDFNGIPLNRQLYSLSYVFFTAGIAGLVLSFLYLLTDAFGVRFYTKLLEWIGRNSLLVFVLGVAGLFPAVLAGFYWGTPGNNLVFLFQTYVSGLVSDPQYGSILGSALCVAGWSLAAGFLTSVGHTWKF